jgi:sterol 3beta-glucosyltransferase
MPTHTFSLLSETANIFQDKGTQIAIQTIYRELDRARSFMKKQDDDETDNFEEDWTIIEEGEGLDIPHPYEVPQSPAGIRQDAYPTGGGSSVLGSMTFQGAGTQKRTSESSRKD